MYIKVWLIVLGSLFAMQTKVFSNAVDSTLLLNHFEKMIGILEKKDLQAWQKSWEPLSESRLVESKPLLLGASKYAYQKNMYSSFVAAYYPYGDNHQAGVNEQPLNWLHMRLQRFCFQQKSDTSGSVFLGVLYLKNEKNNQFCSYRFVVYSTGTQQLAGLQLSGYQQIEAVPEKCTQDSDAIKPALPQTAPDSLLSEKYIATYLKLSKTYSGFLNEQPAIFYFYNLYPEDTVYRLARITVNSRHYDVMSITLNRTNQNTQVVTFFNREGCLILTRQNETVTGTFFNPDYQPLEKIKVFISKE